MRGFDELAKLDPIQVSQQTYISVDEFKAIVEKRFDAFSRTKATGFINILEREYDLDLQEWMDEFELYKMEHNDDKDIFVIAPKESESILENKLYLTLALGIVGLFVVLFALFPSGAGVEERATQVESNHLLEEAQQKIIERNASEKKEPAVQLSVPKEAEEKKAEPVVSPPVKKDIFHVESNVKLWIGIEYLDNGEKTNTIFEDTYELDPTREQKLTFGHGYFKLVFNDKVIEPRERNIFKVTYQNRDLKVTKVPLPKKKAEAPADEPEGSRAEGNVTEE